MMKLLLLTWREKKKKNRYDFNDTLIIKQYIVIFDHSCAVV